MDEIRIRNLEVYAYHGVYPEENEKGQPFFINTVLYTDTREAGLTDELSKSTNYGEVAEFLDKWTKNNVCMLIETVAEQLACGILLNFPLVKAVDLEVRKPEAPIPLPFESVSVKIHREWHKAYLSVGSNMGEKEKQIRAGILELTENPLNRNVQLSELIVTKPYGGVEQDDFVNGAVMLETLMEPKELLEELHRIEGLANRERTIHWGPRTLDLDIVFYDKLIYEDDDLIIPHIDMENRGFVLEPLATLIPNYRHPILQKTVSQMWENIKNCNDSEPCKSVTN